MVGMYHLYAEVRISQIAEVTANTVVICSKASLVKSD